MTHDDELAPDAIISNKITLTPDFFERLVQRLESEPTPTPELVELMRGSRDPRAQQERRERIGAAIREAREIARQMLPGPDTTELIREDRDSGHGRA